MKKKVWFIRILFWVGAIIDAYAAVQLLVLRYATFSAATSGSISGDAVYAVGQAAALMLGWTALLVWGSIKPIERRGVLLLTALPALAALAVNTIQGIAAGFFTPEGKLAALIVQGVFLPVMVIAYCISAKARKTNQAAAS